MSDSTKAQDQQTEPGTDLEVIVQGFRGAEDSLRNLVAQSDRLQSAAESLTKADGAVSESAKQLTYVASQLSESSIQLGTLAAQLASATQALIKSDPEGVKRELGRNVEQIERLRSRLDETSAEQKTRLEASEKAVRKEIEELATQTDLQAEAGFKQLAAFASTAKRYSIATMVLVAVVVAALAYHLIAA